VTVPAAVVAPPTATLMSVNAIVSQQVMDQLGIKTRAAGVYFDTTRMPTAAEEKKADDAVAALGVASPLTVERGYQSQTFAGLLALSIVATVVTLGAAAVATGLAITDAQADLETLVAVGARPRVRRSLAGAQAAATAGLGALLGALFGLVPAAGLVEARARGLATAAEQATGHVVTRVPAYLSIPWSFLLLVVLALPVLAAAGASGLTRSRIVLGRRRA
jgi:putative ABC transport system permease protein